MLFDEYVISIWFCGYGIQVCLGSSQTSSYWSRKYASQEISRANINDLCESLIHDLLNGMSNTVNMADIYYYLLQ